MEKLNLTAEPKRLVLGHSTVVELYDSVTKLIT